MSAPQKPRWNYQHCSANVLLQDRWAIFFGSTDPVRAFVLSEADARLFVDALNAKEKGE